LNRQPIMLIDDSRVSRMMFIKFLNDTPLQFDIHEADSGEDALKVFAQKPEIRKFVVDFNMPGINGLQLIERIQESVSDAKFNLLTANTQPDVFARCKALDVTVTTKPITRDKVIGIIKSLNNL